MGGKAKGNSFERKICTELSLWWTDNDRDDIFWRSASSGGRATSRFRRSKKSTAASQGDITAIDPSGIPFLKVVTVEIKRGYTKDSIQDVIDNLPHRNAPTFMQWMIQAEESAASAESLTWLVISQRNQKSVMTWFPISLFNELYAVGAKIKQYTPTITIVGRSRVPKKKDDEHKKFKVIDVVGIPFENFKLRIRPHHFMEIAECL